jgi:proprotein convertase subtilisin/kexin type 5
MNFIIIVLSLFLSLIRTCFNQIYTQNCLTSTNGQCTQCSKGYNLNKGYCVLYCADNCSLCLTNYYCLQCLPGYYLSRNNSTCIKCSYPCNICRNNQYNNVCTNCNNLDWDGSSCSTTNTTQPNCLKNKTANCPVCGNLCKTCYLDTSKQNMCSECVDNAVFNSTNLTSCYCKPGYTAISNQCKSCKELYGRYCTSCNSTKCLSCFSRNGCVLFSEQNTCICDSKLESNYSKVNQINPITLLSNTSIKYFVPNSNCYAIDSSGNCVIKCTDVYDEKCLNCYDGGCIESFVGTTTYKTCPKLSYAPYSYYSCIKCTNYYSSCYDCSNSECLLCQVNGRIKQCPCKHENMYLSDGDLAIFNTSYYGYKFTCNDCYTQGAYCKNYVNLGKCSDFLPFCSKCNGSICSECQSGYYLDNDGSCKSCQKYDPMCTDCDSTSCLTCNNTTPNPNCIACNLYNCNDCKRYTFYSTVCQSCNDGYYIKNDVCASCSDFGNCVKCNTIGGCNLCKMGYKLDISYGTGRCNMLCNQIFDSCKNCDSRECLECESGYFIESLRGCLMCNSKYQLCDICDTEKCTGCSVNAEFDTDKKNCICSKNYFAFKNNCITLLYPILISVSLGLFIAIVTYCSIYYYKKSRIIREQEMSQNNRDEVNVHQPSAVVIDNNNIKNDNRANNLDEYKVELKRVPTKDIPDDELCQICVARRVEKILECYHLLCSSCLKEQIKRKYNNCPFCRRNINLNNAINFIKPITNKSSDLNEDKKEDRL